MKHKSLGLLAVGLLMGPAVAQASFIYSFSGGTFRPDFGFSLTTASLITFDSFVAADFDQLSPSDTRFVFLFGLDSPDFLIEFEQPGLATDFIFPEPAAGPGTYCPAGGCSFFSLTIRQTAVPEPGTIALLGLGLLGLGVTRRRAN